MAHTCLKCSRSLPSHGVDPHVVCLSCREVICSFASRCDSCRDLSPDQFQRLLESIQDRTARRKASSASGKRKSSPSSRQLQKRMCKMEETLDRLSQAFLSSSPVGSPFSGFQAPAAHFDGSQPGTSGGPQFGSGGVLQGAGQTGDAGPGFELVPAASAGICSFHATTAQCRGYFWYCIQWRDWRQPLGSHAQWPSHCRGYGCQRQPYSSHARRPDSYPGF